MFYVPYRQKGNQVVGRENALDGVHRQLTSGDQRTAIGQAVAFQGLGGLGKTQLAVEYAYRYQDEYLTALSGSMQTRILRLSLLSYRIEQAGLPQIPSTGTSWMWPGTG